MILNNQTKWVKWNYTNNQDYNINLMVTKRNVDRVQADLGFGDFMNLEFFN